MLVFALRARSGGTRAGRRALLVTEVRRVCCSRPIVVTSRARGLREEGASRLEYWRALVFFALRRACFWAPRRLQKRAVTPTAPRYSSALCRGPCAASGARETTADVAISVWRGSSEFGAARLNSSPRVKKHLERTTAVVPRPVADAGALFLAPPSGSLAGREIGAERSK